MTIQVKTFLPVPPPPLPRRITVEQAADVLGIYPGTVRRWIKAGELAGWHVGPSTNSRVVLDAEEVKAYPRPMNNRARKLQGKIPQ